MNMIYDRYEYVMDRYVANIIFVFFVFMCSLSSVVPLSVAVLRVGFV